VGLHRRPGDEEPLRDVGVGQALGDEQGHLALGRPESTARPPSTSRASGISGRPCSASRSIPRGARCAAPAVSPLARRTRARMTSQAPTGPGPGRES
jgi:hypothetical protein